MVLSFLTFSTFALSQGSWSGHGFGDYYYNGSGEAKDNHGFNLNRLNLGYENALGENVTARFALEANNSTVSSDAAHSFFLKDAYVECSGMYDGGSLAIGLIPTPTWRWGISEKSWGYRAVAKTLIDQQNLGTASDYGVSLRGKYDMGLSYNLMLANGNGLGLENNRQKKIYAAVNYQMGDLVAEAYYDDAPTGEDAGKSAIRTSATYNLSGYTVGGDYIMSTYKQGDEETKANGLSVYIHGNVMNNIGIIGRYDMWDPNADVEKDNTTQMIVGADYTPHGNNFHLIPNVVINSDEDDATDDDMVYRLTFSYSFK